MLQVPIDSSNIINNKKRGSMFTKPSETDVD